VLDRYVEHTFTCYWRDGLPIDQPEFIAAVIADLGVDPAGFVGYVLGSDSGFEGGGRAALSACMDALAARGVIGTPTYLVGDEPYLGRQHLPLIRARLTA
jgi:2-hydroxychromene-2-carboxylate isomerase